MRPAFSTELIRSTSELCHGLGVPQRTAASAFQRSPEDGLTVAIMSATATMPCFPLANVRFGSLADIPGARSRHVRFSPGRGHWTGMSRHVRYMPKADITLPSRRGSRGEEILRAMKGAMRQQGSRGPDPRTRAGLDRLPMALARR